MNDRMEREIRRTIQLLQASMPEPRDRADAGSFTLLRIAAGEINAGLLLGLFAGALIFGLLSVRALSMPMLTIFCTAPMPMLLLFHGTCSPAASVCANWKLRFRIPIRKC